ncbi:MAG: helix-turn-helix domain-containing protein [Chloroflexi bacterium]|jgi:DNA-binding MarR family transcriptional regulator|nr:helix-turn-helix domain-containing protein [Chloroflexota bacterium]
MTEAFEALAGLDKIVHEPARLALLTALSACKSADFLALQRLTGLTKGNLSTHLSRLEETGLVEIEKQFIDKKPNTRVRLTQEGRVAIENHWRKLQNLHDTAQQWRPEK